MSRLPSFPLVALILATTCNADSRGTGYFVLEPGTKWTYEMRFWEEGRFAMERGGEHVQWIDGTVEWGGHTYHRLRAKTTGFQNAPDNDQLIRVTGDSVRTVDMGKNPPEEVLSMPLPATPGRSWSIGEGAETWHYALEPAESVAVPAGRFEDCIATVATLESQTSKFQISMRVTRCAGVGMVNYRSKAIHEYGVSNGEYTLVEFEP